MAKRRSSRLRQTSPSHFAKRKRSAAAAARAAVIKAKAERIVDRIQQHYALGREANTAQDKKRITTKQFARNRRTDPGALRRWKRFARLYSVEQLDELCALRRPDQLPLHSGYINYLSSIPSPARRRKFAVMAAKNGWSSARLHREIRQTEGRPAGHGRKVGLPANLREGLHRLASEGRLWLTRAQIVLMTMTAGHDGKATTTDADTLRAINDVAALLATVRAECTQLGKTLEAVKSSRTKPFRGHRGKE